MASVLLRSVLDDNRPVQQRQTSVLLIDPSGTYQPCHGPYHTPHIPNRLHAQHTQNTKNWGPFCRSFTVHQEIFGKGWILQTWFGSMGSMGHFARDYEPGKHMWLLQCFDILHHHITMELPELQVFLGAIHSWPSQNNLDYCHNGQLGRVDPFRCYQFVCDDVQSQFSLRMQLHDLITCKFDVMC